MNDKNSDNNITANGEFELYNFFIHLIYDKK